MVSLIYGADRYVSEVVLDEGTDVFTITRIDDLQFLTDFDSFLESLNNPDLTLDDRDWLAERMDEANSVGVYISRQATLHAGGHNSAARGCVGSPRIIPSSRIGPSCSGAT